MIRRHQFVCWCALWAATAHCVAADRPARSDSADEVFGPDKIWKFHLEISAENWKAMLPTKGLHLFGSPEFADKRAQSTSNDAKAEPETERRGGFKYDFRYVRARLEIDGQCFDDVGVRFKGNSSYGLVGNSPKRPFKIDFDRYVEGRTFHGLKMLNLTNNALDPSQLRESLAYVAFRAAGVPAPRTAFVELSVTVPGRFDRQFVGLYTLIEQVDRTFLQRYFSHPRGMLLKPEGFQGLPYLGDRWQPYAQFYRPKNDPDSASRQRLLQLTQLLSFATDEEFTSSLDGLMDVDNFLRYLAVCSATLNLDSFVGFGHNYYLYLDPGENRFVWIPWDLNGTFGGLGLAGPAEKQIQWTVMTPYVGSNRLAERVLAVPRWRDSYRQHLRDLIDKACHPDTLHPWIDRMQSTVQDVLEHESRLPKPQLSGVWNIMLAMGQKPPDLKDFVTRRAAAVRSQIEDGNRGKQLTLGMLTTPARDALSRQIARPIFKAVDTDRDRLLAIDEITAALRQLHSAAGDPNALLEEGALAQAIVGIFPKPSGLFARLSPSTPQPEGFGAGHLLAGYLGYLSDNRRNEFEFDAWLTVASRLVSRADQDGDQQLDEAEVVAELNWLPPPPLAFDPSAEPGPAAKSD